MIEKRQIIQYKIYILVLTPILKAEKKYQPFSDEERFILSGPLEKQLVGISASFDQLLNWYKDQLEKKVYKGFSPKQLERMEKENDSNGLGRKNFAYYKWFKIGSPLEWYQSLLSLEDIYIHKVKRVIKYVGFHEIWVTTNELQELFQQTSPKPQIVDNNSEVLREMGFL
jgi:hypothetical protein